MKKNQIYICATLMCVFFVCMIFAITGCIKIYENLFFKAINPAALFNPFLKVFTDIGEAPYIIGISAVFLLIPNTRKKIGATLSVTVTSSWLISTIIKNIIHRIRPIDKIIAQGGYSFPSGHAMNNMALYLCIMILTVHFCKIKSIKVIVCIVCSVITFLIGFSRIYFNVHYLSDVIGGWCLGATVAIVATQIYFNIKDKKTGELNSAKKRTKT